MVIRFLAEGAASGLNVIAVYVTEILRVTGVDGRCQDGPCLCACLSAGVAHCRQAPAGLKKGYEAMKVLSASENTQTCLSLR